MLRIFKIKSPNKLRDINIAIAYHNTGRTLGDVACEFGVNKERVRQIHHLLVRHISRCMSLEDIYFHESKKNHCVEIARLLSIYKNMLEGNDMKIEVTINNKDGESAMILSTSKDDGKVAIHLCSENVEVSIDDLKAALKRLSSK